MLALPCYKWVLHYAESDGLMSNSGGDIISHLLSTTALYSPINLIYMAWKGVKIYTPPSTGIMEASNSGYYTPIKEVVKGIMFLPILQSVISPSVLFFYKPSSSLTTARNFVKLCQFLGHNV